MSKSGVRQVYNDLDPAIVEAANVKLFQHKLQALVNGAGYICYLQFEGFLVGTLCPTQLCALVAYKHYANNTRDIRETKCFGGKCFWRKVLWRKVFRRKVYITDY